MANQVQASHILVKTEAEANDLLNKIKAGDSFEALAKTYSQCPSGKRGGDLGYFGKGRMFLLPELGQMGGSCLATWDWAGRLLSKTCTTETKCCWIYRLG